MLPITTEKIICSFNEKYELSQLILQEKQILNSVKWKLNFLTLDNILNLATFYWDYFLDLNEQEYSK